MREQPKRIYFGGTILTMEQDHRADYLVCEKGRILSVGHGKPPEPADAETIDLKGNTLLPSFIDSHSHIFSYGLSFLQLSLKSAKNFQDILLLLEAYIAKKKPEEGSWIHAKDYDPDLLQEKSHITASLLDSVTPRNPVVIHHKSGHMGIFNSKALEAFHITGETPSMAGGHIRIDNGKPTGYLEEADFLSRIKNLPLGTEEDQVNAMKKAQEIYASYGITTAQEGLLLREYLPLYRQMLEKNLLFLDVAAYASPAEYHFFSDQLPQCRGTYWHNLKLDGIKIFLDGSPQGKTAWMKTPYKTGKKRKYCGYPSMTDQEIIDAILLAEKWNMQILAHCNGDMAVEEYLRCLKSIWSRKKYFSRHPVIIHAQFLTPSQLPLVRELEVIPSYFNSHVYYWGDVHIKNFGLSRASQISPAASTAAFSIPFTFHRDTPVLEPDMMETLWCACRRQTKSGITLGDNEILRPETALKALTRYGAVQYGELSEKGSLLPGKKENLVILSADPLKVPVDSIPQIQIVQTIKEGRTIYRQKI